MNENDFLQLVETKKASCAVHVVYETACKAEDGKL